MHGDTRRSIRAATLIAVAGALAGCVSTAPGQAAVQHTSARSFEQVAACAYGILEAARPGKVAFSDAHRDLSVQMMLQDEKTGPLGGGRPRHAQVTVIGAPGGSTVEVASPTLDAEPIWSEIQGCA